MTLQEAADVLRRYKYGFWDGGEDPPGERETGDAIDAVVEALAAIEEMAAIIKTRLPKMNMWRHTCIEAARAAAARGMHPDASPTERRLCDQVVWLCAFGEDPHDLVAVYAAADRVFESGKWELCARLGCENPAHK